MESLTSSETTLDQILIGYLRLIISLFLPTVFFLFLKRYSDQNLGDIGVFLNSKHVYLYFSITFHEHEMRKSTKTKT